MALASTAFAVEPVCNRAASIQPSSDFGHSYQSKYCTMKYKISRSSQEKIEPFTNRASFEIILRAGWSFPVTSSKRVEAIQPGAWLTTETNILDIDTTCGYVRCHQNILRTSFQARQHHLKLLLTFATVQRTRIELQSIQKLNEYHISVARTIKPNTNPEFFQAFSEHIRSLLLVDENNDLFLFSGSVNMWTMCCSRSTGLPTDLMCTVAGRRR